MKEKPKIIVIVGPTASGKTSLSVELAKQYGGEIISADSRQVYRGLNLGTGKVTQEEMQGVPHHLLDVANPSDTYTVADFVRDADKAIAAIIASKKIPIIVGGTFLYVDTLLGKISTPHVAPNPELRAILETEQTERLVERLTALDSIRASNIDTYNRRRLIRAIEIAEALGHVPKTSPSERYRPLTIGIEILKDTLHEHIHKRLLSRIDDGMIEEVEMLSARGLTHERMENLGLEYRYISRFLRGIMTKEQMLVELETKIRQYAKRQMTWLKRNKEIVWVKKDDTTYITKLVSDFLAR